MRKQYKNTLAREYGKSSVKISSKSKKGANQRATTDYFKKFKYTISTRDTDEVNFSVFKQNWKHFRKENSNAFQLTKILHDIVFEFTNSPSPLKMKCCTHLINTIQDFETAFKKTAPEHKDIHCVVYNYSKLALPLPEEIKETYIPNTLAISKIRKKTIPSSAREFALQHTLTGDKSYEEAAHQLL